MSIPTNEDTMEITIGPVWSRIYENIPLARNILQYTQQSFRPGEHGGKHFSYQKVVVNKAGEFLSGFAPRLASALSQYNIPLTFNVTAPAPTPRHTSMRETVLRDYQLSALTTALTKKRGVIQSPTGSGKTVIGMSIVKQFPHQNILWITPTVDLLTQTHTQLTTEFQEEIGVIGDGAINTSRITIGIINSIYKHCISTDFLFNTSIVIVDECHRVSSFSGMYSQTLQSILAPVRIGLTATLPVLPEHQWCLEGNIGPVIKQIKTEDLVAAGNLATPKIRIVKIPLDPEVANLRKYTEVYDQGVVNNVKRNTIIADEIANCVENGETCLVIIRILTHGENLLKILNDRYPNIRAFFAHGITEAEERERIRIALQNRQIDVAITSTIWKEGTDIPSLNTVINAAGSKSEIFCLQIVGRGMRISPGKTTFTIIDFFDPSSHYLVNHFGHRISMYFEKNWM